MIKPDDIPQYVWKAAKAADEAASAAYGASLDDPFSPHEEAEAAGIAAIARAIMAEREACAIAACPPNKVFGHSGGAVALDGYISGRSDAAAAIRNRGA